MTTCISSSAVSPTCEQILESMRRLLESLPPEPLAEFMRSKGMPPERGFILVLPERIRGELLFPPSYVRFSKAASAPLIFQGQMFNPL